MKYWCTTVYDRWHPNADSDGGHIETLSEDEILEEYYPYWSGKMIRKYGQEEFDKRLLMWLTPRKKTIFLSFVHCWAQK